MPLDLTPVTPVALTLTPATPIALTLTAKTTDTLTFAPVGGVSNPPFADKRKNNQDFQDVSDAYPTFGDLKADTS